MTNLKFNLEDINNFISFADRVETQSNLTLLSTAEYVKLEIIFGECYITKHNVKSFIKHKFEVSPDMDDFEFLVHEKILRGFVSTLHKSSKYIYFEISESIVGIGNETFINVKISDNEKFTKGYQSFKYSAKKIDIKSFPNTIEVESGFVRVDQDVISCITTARSFMSNDALRPAFNCIYLTSNTENKGVIYSSDVQKIYIKTFTSQKFPPISITSDECKLICGNNFAFMDYVVCDTHNIYKFGNGSTLYGFRRLENMTGFAYAQFFCQDEELNNNYIELNVDDIILFCMRTKVLSESNSKNSFVNSTCYIGETGKEITFKYLDNEYNVENIDSFEVVSRQGSFGSFHLNHVIWLDMLKTFPYKKIRINNFGDDTEEIGFFANFLSITTEENPSFYCCIGKFTL